MLLKYSVPTSLRMVTCVTNISNLGVFMISPTLYAVCGAELETELELELEDDELESSALPPTIAARTIRPRKPRPTILRQPPFFLFGAPHLGQALASSDISV